MQRRAFARSLPAGRRLRSSITVDLAGVPAQAGSASPPPAEALVVSHAPAGAEEQTGGRGACGSALAAQEAQHHAQCELNALHRSGSCCAGTFPSSATLETYFA